jgi:hypothetical protein
VSPSPSAAENPLSGTQVPWTRERIGRWVAIALVIAGFLAFVVLVITADGSEDSARLPAGVRTPELAGSLDTS